MIHPHWRKNVIGNRIKPCCYSPWSSKLGQNIKKSSENRTECGNECAKACGKNKGLWLMKRTCEAVLGTVLLVVTRVTNTKVVRLYFAFSTIFHGWGWRHKRIGFDKVQRCKMITVTLKPCNIPHRGNWTVMQHLFFLLSDFPKDIQRINQIFFFFNLYTLPFC